MSAHNSVRYRRTSLSTIGALEARSPSGHKSVPSWRISVPTVGALFWRTSVSTVGAHKCSCWRISVSTVGAKASVDGARVCSLSAHKNVPCWRIIVASVGAYSVPCWRTSVFTVAAQVFQEKNNFGRSLTKAQICFWPDLRSSALCSYNLFWGHAGIIIG